MSRKKIVVVESDTKIDIFTKILGIETLSTKGHITEIDKNKGSVDREDINNTKEKLHSSYLKIKKNIEKLSNIEVIIASDNDRAGSFIGVDLMLRISSDLHNHDIIFTKMVFNDLSSDTIIESYNNRNVDYKLDEYYGEKLRRILDYSYGYSLSPVL